jgi:hypothetical protein
MNVFLTNNDRPMQILLNVKYRDIVEAIFLLGIFGDAVLCYVRKNAIADDVMDKLFDKLQQAVQYLEYHFAL